MTDAPLEFPVAPRARLVELLNSKSLSPAVAAAGADLVRRIDTPARITLFGLPGSGKRRVLELLAGGAVLPPGAPATTLSLRAGEVPATAATLADGGILTLPGTSASDLAGVEPVFLDLVRPLPALRTMRLLMVVADDDPADQLAALRWARRQTDIAVWVSRGFGAGEAALWAGAPDGLHDNAYLVLTDPGATASGGGFAGCFPVDVDAAAPALPEGAAGMIEELRRCADRGRQAALDHTLLFLSRYDKRRTPRTTSRPLSRPLSRPVTAGARPAAAPSPAAAAASPMALLQQAMRAAPAEPPAAGAAQNGALPPARRKEPRRDGPRGAADFLRRRAGELNRALEGCGESPAERVLGFCVETIDQLVERVTAQETADPALTAVEELVLDTADVIRLLQSEPGEAPAADAVTLLLQLRRELEMKVAA